MFDRRLEFDYVSAPYEYDSRVPNRLAWVADLPPGTGVTFQIRTARNRAALEGARWAGPAGEGTRYTTSGGALHATPGHRWIQYRAILSSRNGGGSAVLKEVSIAFR